MSLLQRGSRGPEVIELQRRLNEQLYPSPGLDEDGIFGPLTHDAVVAFQRRAGIGVDGMVGPETRAALGMPSSGTDFTHRIRLHFRSISLTDVPFNRILTSTQMVYAQYGIRVDFASGMSLRLSEQEAERFEQIDGTCQWTISSGEYADLQGLGPRVSSNDIVVYFVNRFSENLNGCGGHLPDRPACIVAKSGTRWDTAHEVCHVLLTSSFSPVHVDDRRNLMYPVAIRTSRIPVLTQAQVDQIKSSPLCRRI